SAAAPAAAARIPAAGRAGIPPMMWRAPRRRIACVTRSYFDYDRNGVSMANMSPMRCSMETEPHASHEYRSIRQLVAIGCGIVLRTQRADSLDSGEHRIHRKSLGELLLHLTADRFPLLLRYAPVVATIRHDLDIMVCPKHVDEHAVVRLRIPDTQTCEYLQCACARRDTAQQLVRTQARLERDTDLTAVGALAFCDRTFDRGERGLIKRASRAETSGNQMSKYALERHTVTSARMRRLLRIRLRRRSNRRLR